MSMPGLPEMVFLAILALLVFGPERLPGMARTAGRVYSQLKREASATMDELKKAAELEELRSVRDELRAAGEDIRGIGSDVSAATRDARTTGERALAGPARSARTLPAPFDPDAT